MASVNNLVIPRNISRKSALESLKQKLAERKLVAETTQGAAEKGKGTKTPKENAKPKKKSQPRSEKKTVSPKKNAYKGTEKKGLEKGAVAKQDFVFPPWWHCKKALLEKFPNDTEKRFSSRCYHIVKEFGVKRGLGVEDAKAKGREAHQEASRRCKCMFKPESA